MQQHQEVEKRLQELEKQKQPPQQPGQRNLPPTPDQQRLIAEINALKQRLQETGARSENEVEQWRKVVEQEKVACDSFNSASQEHSSAKRSFSVSKPSLAIPFAVGFLGKVDKPEMVFSRF